MQCQVERRQACAVGFVLGRFK
ncbi:hypothetical protein LINGRAHAP2_LOCUS13128 [Linum grandiflorum]